MDAREWAGSVTKDGATRRAFSAARSGFAAGPSPGSGDDVLDHVEARADQALTSLMAEVYRLINAAELGPAEHVLREVIRTTEEQLGPTHLMHVALLQQLALVLLLADKLPECADVCRRNAATLSAMPGSDFAAGTVHLRLGTAELGLGLHNDAIASFTTALRKLRADPQPELEDSYAEAEVCLALAHLRKDCWELQTGERDAARAMECVSRHTGSLLGGFEQLVAALPVGHPLVQNAMGEHNRLLGDMVEVEQPGVVTALFDQELALKNALQWPVENISLVQYQCATQHYYLGNLERALELAEQSLAVLSESTPEDDNGIALRRMRQGVIAAAAGQVELAQDLLPPVIDHFSDAVGEDSPLVSEASFALALANFQSPMLKLDDIACEEATATMRRCISSMASALGGDHLLVAGARSHHQRIVGDI